MYRFVKGGQEVIIRNSLKLDKKNIDKNEIYKRVVAYAEELLSLEDEADFIVGGDDGDIIVASIGFGEIVVITINHIIETANIYK